ncbi:MAG TPA: hypothetical protein VNK95_08985 [Caldilineaceae bacterium]|nr:hypothetical protein [Caldilineaceae bacterium]
MDKHLLTCVLTQFRANFLTYFPELSDQDLRLILLGPSETLLTVLQAHYGYTLAEAKAAWNDFVLREVDGQPLDLSASDATGPPACQAGRPRSSLRPWLLAPPVRYYQ